jgi:hypothetical protein
MPTGSLADKHNFSIFGSLTRNRFGACLGDLTQTAEGNVFIQVNQRRHLILTTCFTAISLSAFDYDSTAVKSSQ